MEPDTGRWKGEGAGGGGGANRLLIILHDLSNNILNYRLGKTSIKTKREGGGRGDFDTLLNLNRNLWIVEHIC